MIDEARFKILCARLNYASGQPNQWAHFKDAFVFSSGLAQAAIITFRRNEIFPTFLDEKKINRDRRKPILKICIILQYITQISSFMLFHAVKTANILIHFTWH